MFGKANQFATVAGFGVRVKDERENDRNHLIETTFEVPLTHELADEIMPAMARDLFQEVGGEWVPKPEIKDMVFNLNPEQQLMTVRQHPDLDPVFRVAGCTLRKIRARKAEANTWILAFTSTWQLGQDNEAMTIIRALKSGVYLTFEAQQQSMLDPGQAPVNGQEATVDGGGNVTQITDGKKRRGRKPGGGRRTPEEEGLAQETAGAAAAAAEGSGAGDGNKVISGGD